MALPFACHANDDDEEEEGDDDDDDWASVRRCEDKCRMAETGIHATYEPPLTAIPASSCVIPFFDAPQSSASRGPLISTGSEHTSAHWHSGAGEVGFRRPPDGASGSAGACESATM